ncbi:MAG TPA: DUF4340 domain-containing protein [Saprospiraceae bacterium]|nr:DUF4340 domain-containing protein [Saprospiraceae bacterium]
MNRNLVLLILLLVLAGSGWWLFQNQSGSASVVYTDRNFAVEDLNKVHRIVLADKKGHRTELERSGNSWLVNSEYPVNKRRMEVLERTLTDLQIRYIPSEAEGKTAMKQLASYTNQIKMFDSNGEEIRSYLIGGTNANGMGTYMIMEGASQPFVMDIPYFQGAIDLRSDPDPEYWITEQLFPNINMKDIKKLVVKYGQEEANSVVVTQAGRKWQLQPLFPSSLTRNNNVNEARVKAFVTNLLDLKAGRILEYLPGRDESEVKQRVPEIHIQIYDQSDNLFEFFGWQALRKNKQGEIIEGQKELYTPRQVIPTYYFLAPNDFWYSFTFTKLAEVVKPIVYFYEESEN